jgi:hypothetical protein
MNEDKMDGACIAHVRSVKCYTVFREKLEKVNGPLGRRKHVIGLG